MLRANRLSKFQLHRWSHCPSLLGRKGGEVGDAKLGESLELLRNRILATDDGYVAKSTDSLSIQHDAIAWYLTVLARRRCSYVSSSFDTLSRLAVHQDRAQFP